MDELKKPEGAHSDQHAYLEHATLGCTEIEELLDYHLEGELLPALEAKFQHHVAECDICEELVHDCTHLVSLARSLNDTPIPAEAQSRLRAALKREVEFDPGASDHDSALKARLTLLKPNS